MATPRKSRPIVLSLTRNRAARFLAVALVAAPIALAGNSDSARALGSVTVNASLDRCGTLQGEVVCKLDASFGLVPGATSYSATVIRPDGSAVDQGTIAGTGSASFYVPYAGDGTYTVQISAYG
jgi:hypothetical protein